jgi:hypothetical protein
MGPRGVIARSDAIRCGLTMMGRLNQDPKAVCSLTAGRRSHSDCRAIPVAALNTGQSGS